MFERLAGRPPFRREEPGERHDSCLAFVRALRGAVAGAAPGSDHPPTEVDVRVVRAEQDRPEPPPRWAEPVFRGRS